MATISQQPPVALSRISPAAPGTGRGQGSVRDQQHGSTALGRPQSNTQPSSTQQIIGVATVSAQQPYNYASFYSRLATTLTNVVLISVGLVIAGVYGKIAEKQGNESLKATLWRDCIDLPVGEALQDFFEVLLTGSRTPYGLLRLARSSLQPALIRYLNDQFRSSNMVCRAGCLYSGKSYLLLNNYMSFRLCFGYPPSD